MSDYLDSIKQQLYEDELRNKEVELDPIADIVFNDYEPSVTPPEKWSKE